MEKKVYSTLIKEDHKLGKIDYVIGRIVGIQYMCGYDQIDKEFGIVYIPNVGNIVSATFESAGDYSNFMTIIERLYPGLCTFDYKG
jgi:hypothetical protein